MPLLRALRLTVTGAVITFDRYRAANCDYPREPPVLNPESTADTTRCAARPR